MKFIEIKGQPTNFEHVIAYFKADKKTDNEEWGICIITTATKPFDCIRMPYDSMKQRDYEFNKITRSIKSCNK